MRRLDALLSSRSGHGAPPPAIRARFGRAAKRAVTSAILPAPTGWAAYHCPGCYTHGHVARVRGRLQASARTPFAHSAPTLQTSFSSARAVLTCHGIGYGCTRKPLSHVGCGHRGSGLTPEACRAGRALLMWSMRDLARNANVSLGAITRLESGGTGSRRETLDRILASFAANGVDVVSSPEETGAVLVYARRR